MRATVGAATGVLHILYHDTGTGSLRHARRGPAGGAWTFETIEMGMTSGRWVGAVTDPTGALFVAYQRGRNDDLYFARQSGGAWVVEPIATDGNTGYHPQLGRDSTGTFHVVHYDLVTLSDGSLHYATGRPGAWTNELLDPDYSTGAGHVSLAIAPDDVPHAVYRAASELRHAWRAGDGVDQNCDGADG